MVKVGRATSIQSLRIIIAFTITFGWCAVNIALRPSSCESFSMLVTAFDSVPKPTISKFHRQEQSNQQQSHILEAVKIPSDQNISIRLFMKNERYPNFTSELVSDRSKSSIFGSLLFAIVLLMNAATAFAGDFPAIDSSIELDTKSSVPISIVSCATTSGSTNNCVSTASVKQVDLFMLPWTWPESISGDEVISRLKGIVASDQTLSIVESTKVPSSDNYFFRIRAARNVCNDEIEMLINPNDRVITFRSQQVDGPDSVSDFGANRRRLEDIRKRLKVVTILGGGANADYYRNGESSEGITGQLKAFWGFQSGGGFESILLDDDE